MHRHERIEVRFMSKLKQRLFTLFCVGALALSVSAGAAGATEARATLWTDPIYVDGVNVGFQNEQSKQVNALAYNGTTYIPVRSAGEWMGCTVVWDQAAQTIRLTSGGTRTVAASADIPGLSLDELEVFLKQKENGISIMLRPDLKVTLDGKQQQFQNAKGEPVYPVTFENVTYLPARSVGEMCGLEAAFVPKATPDSYQWIILYTPLTADQKTAAKTYLSTVQTAYDKLSTAVTAYSAALAGMSNQAAVEKMTAMSGLLKTIVDANVDIPTMKFTRTSLSMAARGAIEFGSVGSSLSQLAAGKQVGELTTGQMLQADLNTLKSAVDDVRCVMEAMGITA